MEKSKIEMGIPRSAEASSAGKIESGRGLNILSPDFVTKFQDLTSVNLQGHPIYKDLLDDTKDEVNSEGFRHIVQVVDGINFDLVILKGGEIALQNKYDSQKNTDSKSAEILKRASDLGVAVYTSKIFH